MVYANILYHFGRGMAFLEKSQPDNAKNELTAMQSLMNDSSLSIPLSPFSAAIEGAQIAANMLSGSINLKENKMNDAISAFEKAVNIEDDMVYNEPRDWMLNPKQYLANALLKDNQPEKARIILEKDLKNNRENGWALYGIWQALNKEHKKNEAKKIFVRFNTSFKKADIKLNGPVL